jgi:glycosyltransferase involved in cell wall biosynthesis
MSYSAPPANGRKISVIILSKDEPDLATSLELLRPQCEAMGAQCIVVDASEGRLEFIHRDHPWTTWIDFSGPFWRSSTIPHQRNAGCHAATGDIIAFCDSGGEPSHNWLTSITAPLLSGAFTLVCGPVYSKRVGVYSVMNDVADGEVVTEAPTANMAFLKSVFDQVNDFDERLFYGSDTDFVWRCADAQHPCYQVRDAGMLMDFGDLSRTMHRSWLYGRGWARLYGLHPERHVWMIKKSPERVVYPAWILIGPLFLLAGRWRKLRFAPLAWLGLLGLLLVRNRKAPTPHKVIVDHMVGGVSVLNETFRRVIGETAPVIFLPDDQSPYQRHLAEALTKQGTPVDFWRGPTRSASLNILFGPLWVILLAWRGAQIIHIHWTYGFSRCSSALGGRIARYWFGVFLSVSHATGLKIIWTAHNVLPHEAVFDDDLAARKILTTRADAIIALSPHSAKEISELFGATKVAVVPHGPFEIMSSAAGRDSTRKTLKVGSRLCFSFFGHVRPYKGIETLIASAELLGAGVAVRITGSGEPAYVSNLTRMVTAANSAGADIQFESRWRSDAEIADLLAASDVCVFPFIRADNSGSVLLALATGLPVIIPDLASLRHIDNAGVLRYDPADPVRTLSDTMITAAMLSHDERVSMGCAAREWALGFNWSAIAEETVAVYTQTIRDK